MKEIKNSVHLVGPELNIYITNMYVTTIIKKELITLLVYTHTY
jgi:hypothetical protein